MNQELTALIKHLCMNPGSVDVVSRQPFLARAAIAMVRKPMLNLPIRLSRWLVLELKGAVRLEGPES